jgi:DNA-binding GntR family transcriptional regulator
MPEREADYERVANDLRQKIRTGALAAGERLPTKNQLAEIYSVGGSAVDTAMLLLRTEGYVIGHQGKGRFVAEGKDDLRPPD